MSETDLALLVLAGPLAAAVLLGCVPPLRRAGRGAALVSLAGIAVALAAAVRLVAGLWIGRAEYRGARGQRRARGAPDAALARAGRPRAARHRRASTSTRSRPRWRRW